MLPLFRARGVCCHERPSHIAAAVLRQRWGERDGRSRGEEGYPMRGILWRGMIWAGTCPLVGGAWPPLCYAVTCRASMCRRNACVCDPSRCGASRMSGVTRRHRRQCMPGRMCYAVWPVGGVCPRLSSASTGECASAACVRVCEHASDCRVSAEVWHTPSPWERASVCRCPMLVGGSDTAWTRVRRQSAVWGGAWSVSYLPNRGCGLWLVRQASASHSSAKPFAHSPPSGVRAHAIPAHNVLW